MKAWQETLKIFSFIVMLGCGTYMGNPGQPVTGADSDPSSNPTYNPGDCVTVEEKPQVSGGTGQFHFKLAEAYDKCGVQAYLVGYENRLPLIRAQDGTFIVDRVPPGKHDVIIVSKGGNNLLPDTSNHAMRLNNIEFLAGLLTDLNTLDLPVAGAVSGSATLNGKSDHSGIHVYIPGTSFSAFTDASGKYTISPFVPVGKNNLHFEKDGYHRGQIEDLAVAAGASTIASDISLSLSTGAEGFIALQGGGNSSESRTVKLTIGATENAVLMKLSESANFEGASWRSVVTSTTYTFATAGQKTLYVAFADANGLVSSPFRLEVVINLFPAGPNLKLAADAKSTNNRIVPFSITLPRNAKSMMMSSVSGFANASWEPAVSSSSFEFDELGTKTLYIKFKDADNFESPVYSASIVIQEPAESFSFSQKHGCVVTQKGAVKCFTREHGITAVPGLESGVVQVETGLDFSCALTNTGGVKCWGANRYCELGSGSSASSDLPVDVVGLSAGVRKISIAKASQYQHACAIMDDGQMKCWGANQAGQLGNAGTSDSCSPIAVAGVTNVVASEGGNEHRCALNAAGGVLCWGLETLLGIGSTAGAPQPALPQTVPGVSAGVLDLAVGGHHSCALMATGGVKCWGLNGQGQTGTNSNASIVTIPQNVTNLTSGVDSIALSEYAASCAVMANGSVQCWGRDYYLTEPNVGIQPDRFTPTPINIVGEPGIKLSLASNDYCALLSTGAIKCWGPTWGVETYVTGFGSN